MRRVITMKLNAENLFAKGLIFYKSERYYREALRIFNAALQLAPKNYDALYFRSECYRRLGNDRQARADLTKAKALDPHDAEFYFKRGMSLEKNQHWRGIQHIISFSRAIAYKPDFAEAYFQRGKTFWSLNHSEYWVIGRAYSDVEQALELNPNCSEFYDTYAGLCNDAGRRKEGFDFFSKIIEHDPKNIAAYKARLSLYDDKSVERLKRIIDDCNKIIESDNSSFYRYVRGQDYYHLEQYEQAIEDCTKLIEINPTYAEAYNLRGKCFEAMGDETRAREDFFKCKELHCERETDPYYKLIKYGKLYREHGDYARAIEKLSEAITLKPESAQAYEMRGGCFDALGDTVRAGEDFAKVEKIRSAPRKKDAWEVRRENREKLYSEYLNLARDADKNQDYAAIECFTEAIKISPTCSEAYFLRGKIYFELRYYDKAIHDFNKVIELDPDDAEAYEMRGEIYFATGETMSGRCSL